MTSPRGRPANQVPVVKKKISIPESLIKKAEIFLIDPLYNRLPYNAWGAYITRLVHEDVARKEAIILNTTEDEISSLIPAITSNGNIK